MLGMTAALSVVDIFDTNKYAHDPREDFLNWSILDVGAFDYAADAWGTTYSAAAEWYQGRYAARVGLFDLQRAEQYRPQPAVVASDPVRR
jgi:high affinity Mn2+ porin